MQKLAIYPLARRSQKLMELPTRCVQLSLPFLPTLVNQRALSSGCGFKKLLVSIDWFVILYRILPYLCCVVFDLLSRSAHCQKRRKMSSSSRPISSSLAGENPIFQSSTQDSFGFILSHLTLHITVLARRASRGWANTRDWVVGESVAPDAPSSHSLRV